MCEILVPRYQTAQQILFFDQNKGDRRTFAGAEETELLLCEYRVSGLIEISELS